MSVGDLFQKIDADELAKAMASDDPNDLVNLAQENGLELSLEQLDYVAGGSSICDGDNFSDSDVWQ